MLASGECSGIQKYRKYKSTRFQNLKDSIGKIVWSHERAEGLATHLKQLQCAVRLDIIPSNKEPIFVFRTLNTDDFSIDELVTVVKALKKGKACGDNDIPGEFWQICLLQENWLEWLLKFCNLVWHSQEIPHIWHRAKVACLFKKGDLALPENNRPISLHQIGYKIFSSSILQRFQDRDIDEKL